MALKVWIHCIGGEQKPAGQEVAELLAKQGIEVHDVEPHLCSGPGLILCSEVTAETCLQFRELSRSGEIQVLAGCCAAIPADTAWRLMEAGASDVIACIDANRAAGEIAARLRRWEAVEQMVNFPSVQGMLVGKSQAFRSTLRQLVEVANFTDSSILILGESGTGKELLAQLVHALDPRPDKGDLIIQDCSTTVSELSGSEFFGHERGAFTDAVSPRDGVFALADGGTLFLDEVGELPLKLQGQLLRVIQERTFKRVGGNVWHRSSFRLVCATNRDLSQQVERSEFRADLYYRIACHVCRLPPLRERPEDILPLAGHFLKELRPGQAPPELDAPVQEFLLRREYPGNVRDLKQVVARMLSRHAGLGPITLGCIPPDDRPVWAEGREEWRDAGFERALRVALNRGVGLKSISRSTEEAAIRIAVDETGGNLQRAAQRLGVTDRSLQMRRAAQRLESGSVLRVESV
jgi:transcriptional regulator with GAF, ATPase, and Fis domain